MTQPYRRINARNVLHSLALACIPLVAFAYSLPGQAKEAGPEHLIVTAVKGAVTYTRLSESEEPQAVAPFLKLEEGDILNLAMNSRINMLFIARGLGETWQGPKTLQFQNGQILSQSQGVWNKERPEILKSLLFEPQKVLDQSVLLRLVEQIRGTPRSIPRFREIPKEQAATIEKTYSILRREFGEDDATPDLYRLSVLAEYGQYDKMLPLLQELLATYHDNPILLGWKEWVESRNSQ